jgi:hypothetical protein
MKWIGRSYRNILLQLKTKDSFFYWHMGIRMVQSKYRYTKNTRLYGKVSLKWKQVKKIIKPHLRYNITTDDSKCYQIHSALRKKS